MNKKQKHYGFFFWIHLFLFLFSIILWIFFSWWLIIIVEIILQLQYWLLKGCILSKAEFGKEKDEACVPYYLKKWNLIKNKEKTKIVVRYYLPIFRISFGIIWQLFLGFNPLFF